MKTRWQKPHRYDVSVFDARCMCGLQENHRLHQPLWWRALFPHVQWRHA